MRHAETVTFGGGGLDRAAHLRGRPEELAAYEAAIIPMWKGRPAFLPDGGDGQRLVRVAAGHTVLGPARQSPVFLGLDGNKSMFAQDISAWKPEGEQPDPTLFFDASEQPHPALPADARFAELRGRMALLSPLDAELAATARSILSWHRSHRFCAACGQPSDMVQSGWQRGCLDCGTQHFPRTDPVVIMLVTRGNSVLLGRSPGWPEGMYSLLAGFLEPGETIEAAVRREVYEEAGVQVGQVGYLASQPWPYPSSLMIGCHAEALDTEITLDPAELDHAFWVTREEVLRAFAGGHPVVRPPRKGAIAHFLLQNWLADKLE
ncbi:NAD(+) diphosphatase [Aliiroseovarius sp.]|uniref:NAD(+) diphosphatase n=1 Tax=Aliiroseovarius sp. TaxID=1872442 RepID=UPI00261D678E|nr:NAD(+) diphosphatase [Aliiroseovarius sp.]